jgi:hypothetical protein
LLYAILLIRYNRETKMLMEKLLMKALSFTFPQAIVLFALFSLPAYAVPVVWSVDGLARADGGTVSGSFTYDADTNTYSAINVTTTAGASTLPGQTYAGFDPASSDATGLILEQTQGAADLTGQNSLFLAFPGPGLTNAGGTITPALAEEVSCTNADCSTSVNAQALTGDITGAAAPLVPTSIPTVPFSALMIMALGLLMLGKRQFQNQQVPDGK